MQTIEKQLADEIRDYAESLEYSGEYEFESGKYTVFFEAYIESHEWSEDRPDWGVENLVKYRVAGIENVRVHDENDELVELSKLVYKNLWIWKH